MKKSGVKLETIIPGNIIQYEGRNDYIVHCLKTGQKYDKMMYLYRVLDIADFENKSSVFCESLFGKKELTFIPLDDFVKPANLLKYPNSQQDHKYDSFIGREEERIRFRDFKEQSPNERRKGG